MVIGHLPGTEELRHAGFTTVARLVRCPNCGNKLQGDPRDATFQDALAAWKADLEDMPDDEVSDDEPAGDGALGDELADDRGSNEDTPEA